MQRQQLQSSSIDLSDLKGEIVKKIGLERSRRYFYYLSRLLIQKLSKNEFDKLCTQVIGKENLSLHNKLIRSILNNACDGKVPADVREAGCPAVKSASDDGYKQSGYAGLAQGVPWSNGVVSPKKSKSSVGDRKLKNQPGLVNGKLENAYHPELTSNKRNGQIILENGDASPSDYQRLSHSFSEQPRESHGLSTDIKVDGLHKDGLSRDPLHSPLGIPFCRYSIGGSHNPVPTEGFNNVSGSCSSSDSLPDSESLQKCMEQIAVAQGFEGVSLECANILNSGLDVYLKRLITSCVSLVGGKAGIGIVKQISQKQQIQSKLLNGLLPTNHYSLQNNGGHIETLPENKPFYSMSMLDFKVAMELNPQKLGEDWPLLLEKISMDHAVMICSDFLMADDKLPELLLSRQSTRRNQENYAAKFVVAGLKAKKLQITNLERVKWPTVKA